MRRIATAAFGAMAAAGLGGCGGESVDTASLANATNWTVVYEEEADILGPPFDPGGAGGNGLAGEGSQTDNAADQSSVQPE